MTDMPEQGQQLPDVEFITEDENRISAADLTGQKTVLYFYPKDDTPGCTAEACSFRDRISDYEQASIKVYGVSLYSPESHRQSHEKHNLNFPLLTDKDGQAAEALIVCSATGASQTAASRFYSTLQVRFRRSIQKFRRKHTLMRYWRM